MAIVDFKRIDLIGHSSLKKKIVSYLQNRGCVEIITKPEENGDLEYGEKGLETDIQAAANEIQDIKNTINILESYTPRQSLFERITDQPDPVSESEYQRLVDERDRIKGLVQECIALNEKRLELEKRIEKTVQKKEEIRPWKSLDISLNSLDSFTHVETLTGKVPAEQADTFRQDFGSLSRYVVCSPVYTDDADAYMCIIFHKRRKKRVQEYLAASQFETVALPRADASADELFKSYTDEISSCNKETREIEERFRAASKSLEKIKAVYDHSSTVHETISAERHFGSTSSSFKLRGWIPSREAESVLRDLEQMKLVHADVYIPTKDDPEPPVLLDNGKGIQPFELVTRLYGLPSYGSMDPTGFLAPFFFLFFGLCLSDAAYGILLMVFTVFCIKKLKLDSPLFRLLFLCGIGTVIGGAVTGSWFGVNVCRLPDGNWASFLSTFALLDPIGTDPEPFFGLMLEGTMAFFYLSIALGYIQIFFGTLLALKENIRLGMYVEGILNDGAWLCMYIGLAMLACSAESVPGLASYGLTGLRVPSLYILMAGLGFRIIVYPACIAAGGSKQTTLGRTAGLYALSAVQVLDKSKDLLGNTLSYCRLMALGMATGIVGTVVNQLALQVKAIPVVGAVLLVIVLCGGHIFNLLINLLGAFVHTARLQYVEFFPYFFRGGGAPFKPLAVKNTYIQIK